jgi:hypothetical protein
MRASSGFIQPGIWLASQQAEVRRSALPFSWLP